MASTHKSLRSGTANKRPTTSIADGQIALNTNTTSPGLFFKDSTGATIIKVGPVHVGTTAPNASPAAGGSAGNSVGEIWLDTSLTPVGVKIWNGSAFVNATPVGSTTVQGLLELATNAETQTGTDPDRAVTPAGLQSKVSDSTSTTSSTTIASSTAVKSAYDLANAALPKSGGTVTGNLEIGTTGSLSFEGATADNFETTIAVVDPTADRTITLPDTTGTVVTTGDTGTVTSTMIADGTIVDGDISASAEIAVSKLADGTARQLLQTDAAGTGVEWASNIDVPGTLDVTSTATFDSIASHPLGSAAAPTLTFTGDTNTGIYSPGADQVAISTGGSGRLFINSTGNVGIGAANTGAAFLEVGGSLRWQTQGVFRNSTNTSTLLRFAEIGSRDVRLDTWDGTDFNGTIRHGAQTYLVETGTGASLTERLRVTSAGLVGIGTSSPGVKLTVVGSPGDLAAFSNATDASVVISANSGVAKFTNDSVSGSFAFGTGSSGTERLRITSAGNVGIGTTSPGNPLAISQTVSTTFGNAGTYLGLGGTENTSGQQVLIGFGYKAAASNEYPAVIGYTATSNAGNQNGAIVFGTRNVTTNTAPTERVRIDADGRLLVGTFTTYNVGSTVGAVFQQVNTDSVVNASFSRYTNDTNGAILSLGKSRGTSAGSYTIVQSGDELGSIRFAAADGTDLVTQAAQITCSVDGTPGANDMPGRLVFSTTADGASSPTERMRISSTGMHDLYGLNDTIYSRTNRGAGTSYVTFAGVHSATGSGTGTASCYIYSNGNIQNTNGSYTTLSDVKLKENIVDAGSQWDDLKSIQIRNWNFKAETGHETHRQIGPIAQELETVCPGLVFETPDRDEDGNETGEVTKGVNQSVLYMKAVKALQEAMERIEQLETEMAAVKAQLS